MDLPTTHYDKAASGAADPKLQEKTTDKKQEKKSGENKLEKSAFYVFLVTIFLAPLVFIPSNYAPLDVVKTVFISCGILISCILYGVSIIKNRTLSMPRNALAYCSMAIIISTLLSTLLSGNISKSFFGQGFEIGTASFIILMFIAMFFTSRLVGKNNERGFSIYLAILVSFLILVLFHVIRLIGGADVMSFGILTTLTSTLIGKWYDFAILTGLVGLLSLIGIKFLSPKKGMKYLLVALLILYGAILFAINFYLAWWGIALVTLALGLYEYFSRSNSVPQNAGGIKKMTSRISIVTLAVFIIAIACAVKGNALAGNLTTKLHIDQGEVVLPWQMSLDVTADTIKEAPIFGVGPNRFGVQFLKYKPAEINPTQFWTVEFTNGFGNIPSFLVTQGILGGIAWLLFFIFFIRFGILALRRTQDPLKKFFVVSSFFMSSFLWIVNIIYIPSHAIFLLAFIMSGLFFASLQGAGLMEYRDIGPQGSIRMKKYAPILLAIFLVVMILWLGAYVKKSVALAYFQSGIKELSVTRSLDTAQAKFKKALWWDASDVNYQALSETDILKISDLVQQIQNASTQNPNQKPDQKIIDQVSGLVTEALGYTNKAIAADPTNYYNYIAQARISEVGTSLQIPNAYDNAKNSYIKAISLNPYNPALYLNLARLDASQNKFTEGEQYVGKALQIKQNYTDAVFLLSQLQVSNGELKNAIISAQFATQINPTDPLLWFELGLLDYNDKNYADAAVALSKAVGLNNQYANARYFLGLSDARLGKNADAIAQFQELLKTNPDSKEVSFILSNLQAGKSPFTDAVPPIDSKPEKRKSLPITDKSAAASGGQKIPN